SDLVQEIKTASQQQKDGVDQMQRSVHHLDSLTQGNAASSEELASTAEELHAQAQSLWDGVSFFKLEEGDDTIHHLKESIKSKPIVTKTVRARDNGEDFIAFD
ncbi:MAG TPA: hypothetical protein PLY93_01775, partial [Turneriella sp.]|nr:hypothetical protein [Turneriella sp.]